MWIAILLLTRAAAGAEQPPRPTRGEGVREATSPDPTLADIDAFIAEQHVDTRKPGWRTRLPKPPRFTFKTDALYDWVLRTSAGVLKIRLMPDLAPMHVSSTIYLTRLGFYDGLPFHRVTETTVEGGAPNGDGTGGPGYTYYRETSAIVKHDTRGLLTMGSETVDGDGSSFILTLAPAPSLDGTHSIFGEVVEGDDVLTKLAAAGAKTGTPHRRPVIEQATIERARPQ